MLSLAIAPNVLGLCAGPKLHFNKDKKMSNILQPNSIPSADGLAQNPMLCVRAICCTFALSFLKFFYLQYLRCVGKQWLCPAYILPHFLTPEERVTPRNLLDSVECPMWGNNWTPAQPGSVGRHAFLFPKNLLSNINTVSKHDAQLVAIRSSINCTNLKKNNKNKNIMTKSKRENIFDWARFALTMILPLSVGASFNYLIDNFFWGAIFFVLSIVFFFVFIYVIHWFRDNWAVED
jgi:hypothetical protein